MQEATVQPANVFIVKLADRCNLACKYCYVFEFDKQISAGKPHLMSHEIWRKTMERIATHYRTFPNQEVVIGLHGGEPLLIGKNRLEDYLAISSDILHDVPHRYSLQTNALLLDDEWLDLLDRHSIQFCISLDGPPEVNDLYRLGHQGQPTGRKVVNAIIRTLNHPARRLFTGVFSVASPAYSGAKTYEYFLSLGLKSMDFLIPDGNYLHPPIQCQNSTRTVADFLIEAFDAWFDGEDTAIRVRLFHDIILLLFGAEGGLDIFGGVDGSIGIIETDGGLLPHDVLRTCGPPYDVSGLNVNENTIADLMDAHLYPWLKPVIACTRCKVQPVCRGGYAPHRYDGKSFDNVSYHCPSLLKLIEHIASRVLRALAPDKRENYPILLRAAGYNYASAYIS
jgi:uncharacterized protein